MIGTVLLGNSKFKVQELEDNFFQCIVTSPPYFGHRNYSDGNDCEIGCETNHTEYVENLAAIFSVLKSKLRDNGLLWINMGDTYREKNY